MSAAREVSGQGLDRGTTMSDRTKLLVRTVVRAAGACAVFAMLAGDAAAIPVPAPSFTPNHLFVGGRDDADGLAAVFEFTETGAFVRKIQLSGTGGDHVYDLHFAPDGRLYCALLGGRVVRVDASLAVTGFLDGSDGLINTTGATFGPQGRLYVSNRYEGGTVLEVDAGGNVVDSFTPKTGAPSYVTFGPEGHPYVSMYGGALPDDVHELGPDLEDIRQFGGATFTDYPAHVLFGRNDVVYVADYSANAMRRFDADGVALADLPATGLSGPYGDVVGPDGNLYVANYGGHGVHVLNPATGATVRTIEHEDLGSAAGVAFAPFRFRTTLKGALLGTADGAAELEEAPAVVSVSPGSGRVMIDLADTASDADVRTSFPGTDALVFHGNDMVTSNTTVYGVHATSVSRPSATRSIGSVDLVVRGVRGKARFFVPKTIDATLHLGRPGMLLNAAFRATKRVP